MLDFQKRLIKPTASLLFRPSGDATMLVDHSPVSLKAPEHERLAIHQAQRERQDTAN